MPEPCATPVACTMPSWNGKSRRTQRAFDLDHPTREINHLLHAHGIRRYSHDLRAYSSLSLSRPAKAIRSMNYYRTTLIFIPTINSNFFQCLIYITRTYSPKYPSRCPKGRRIHVYTRRLWKHTAKVRGLALQGVEIPVRFLFLRHSSIFVF